MPPLLGFIKRRPRATPAVLVSPSVTAGIGQSQQQFAAATGAAVTSTLEGFAQLQEQRNTELARVDFETMKSETAAARNDFLKSLRTTDADYNEINKMWEDFKKTTFKEIGGTTNQKKAQKAYGSFIRSTIPRWDREIDNIAWAVSVPRAKTQLFNTATEFLRNAPDFDEGLMAAGMALEESNLLTSEEKDLALANAVIETNPQWYLENVEAKGTKELFSLLSSEQKRALNNRALTSLSRIRLEDTRQLEALREGALGIVTSIAVKDGWDAALKFLDNPKEMQNLMDMFGIKLEDTSQLVNLIKDKARRSRAEGIVSLQRLQDDDILAIEEQFRPSGDLDEASMLIDASKLSGDDKFTWNERLRTRVKAINNKTNIITDQVVKGNLEDMANDIVIGSVTKQETMAALNEAWAPSDGSTPKLNDGDYSDIRTLIGREHKSYQSTAMKEAVNFGAGQLVTVTQSLLDTLLAADAPVDLKAATNKRELELWNMGQYRKAMNDWFAEHPEANSDEIYIQSRTLLPFYRRSVTEIDSARTLAENRLTSKTSTAPLKVQAKFKNPIRVVSPDGVKGWADLEHFEKGLSNLGFKRVENNADDN